MKKTEKYMYICYIIFLIVISILALWLPEEFAGIIGFVVGISFIVVICKISFKNVNGVIYTYDTSDLNKLNEYEKIYIEFYKKYKIFFDRNKENEKKDKKISVSKVVKVIAFLLAFAGLIGVCNENAESFWRILSFLSLIVGTKIIIYFEDKEKSQLFFVRNQAIQDLLALINNTFVYSDEKQDNIKEQYYKLTSLTGENVTNCYSENHIYGYLDDKKEIYMEMADVLATEKIYYPEERDITSFMGVFIAVNTNKEIDNTIKVVPNVYFNDIDDVKMDNTEFERYFDIKCEDKVLTMRIFTAEVIDKLCDLYNTCEIQFEIIIHNNKIYLRFDFSPILDINEWTLSKDNIKYNCERVMYVIEIAKTIAQAINELEI